MSERAIRKFTEATFELAESGFNEPFTVLVGPLRFAVSLSDLPVSPSPAPDAVVAAARTLIENHQPNDHYPSPLIMVETADLNALISALAAAPPTSAGEGLYRVCPDCRGERDSVERDRSVCNCEFGFVPAVATTTPDPRDAVVAAAKRWGIARRVLDFQDWATQDLTEVFASRDALVSALAATEAT